MRVLVLGGTRFVGRTALELAVSRGHEVTIVHRGLTGNSPPGVEAILGDRTLPGGLDALGGREWDFVLDTWAGPPRVVLDAARRLADSVGRYAYVSSLSAHRWPPLPGATEDAPTVDARPDAEEGDYASCKRGAELAVRDVFGARALIARPGLILGPYEDIGRLPWWLNRMLRGGPVLAPAPPTRPLQYIDARDLVGWLLDAPDRGLSGVYITVSRPGHTTLGALLEICRQVTGGVAELVWVDEQAILDAGIEPWIGVPIWLPFAGGAAALQDADPNRAQAAGLRCRPVEETVADTWAWLRSGAPPRLRDIEERMTAETEAAFLRAWTAPSRGDHG
ncbi:MAG TPA: NAD-dependent epimerase/dehydratase family protein [Mycobacteriales bacterium]|nr:NAD-dependent epimerase/dehydratase family protein [Mycobacteriales bacterium]